MTNVFSILAVAGAWVGGLGLVFSVTCFCFGVAHPRLLRWGLNYLLATDVGLIVMLAALLGLIDNTALRVFDIIGIVLLLGLTVAAFIIVRVAGPTIPQPASVLESVRRRVEF